MRWGISIPYPDAGLAEQAERYAELGRLGYTDFWTVEASGWDGFTPLTVAALTVPNARIGTAIVPVYSRGPALLASSAAAMAELAGDRFTLGIGTSTKVMMTDWNAIPFVEPFQRTRDMVRFLRTAMTGARVDTEYDTFAVHGFRLDRPPPVQPQILVAALRPGMLAMAGTEGDGAILSWLSADDVATVAPHVGPGKPLVARIFVSPSTDTDTDAVRTAARRVMAAYLTAPVYRKFHEWLGRSDLLGEMWRLWESGRRRESLSAIPDEVVDDLVVHGTPEQCVARIRRYVANGIQVPLIMPLPVGMSTHEAAVRLAPAFHSTHPH